MSWNSVFRLHPYALVLALVFASACGKDPGDEPSPGGSGGDIGVGGGGTGGDPGIGGSGGGGGDPVVCEEDCSQLDTGTCEVAVCNDGSHDGPVGECVLVMAPNDTACDDGLFCTVGDVCVEGLCTGTAPNDCGLGGSECTTVVCDEEAGACSEIPANEGSSCDDGLFCTVNDVCVEGVCLSDEMNDCGLDGSQCTAIACDEETKSCDEVPANEGSTCDDGLFCTVNDVCEKGECTATEANDCGMEGDQCTTIACDESSRSCDAVPANEGQTCDDGLFCTVGDSCVAGVCTPSAPNDCGLDGSQCTEVVCDEGSRSCDLAPINEGGNCDDGQFCTVGDTCVAGECVSDQANDCGLDATACTAVSCNESARSCDLVAANEGNSCDDGLFCTLGDSCVAGECVSDQANDCGLSGSFCAQVACDESARSCDLVAVNEGQSCGSNSDLCLLDTCVEGACLGLPKDCSGSDTACGVGTCDPGDGSCRTELLAVGTACREGECAVGTCLEDGSCAAEALADGTTCAASASCLTDGICLAGGCFESDRCRTYLFEDFTGCPATWTSIGGWECGTPTSGPGGAFSGSESFATGLTGNYSSHLPFGDSWLQSPEIDLTHATDPEIQIAAWMYTEANWDGWNIKVSTDGGQTFELATDVSPPYGNLSTSTTVGAGGPAWSGNRSANGWEIYSANLSDWIGQRIVVRLDFRADGSTQHAGVYVDDIYVQERAISPLQIEGDGFNAFTNTWSQAFPTKRGGSADTVWTVEGGENHGWLSIDAGSGEIGGTPGNGDLGRGYVTIRAVEPSAPWNYDETTLHFLVSPQPMYWTDFEDCAGWTFGPETRAATDWACGVPTSGPASATSGSQVLTTGLSSNYGTNMRFDTHYALSPPVHIPAGSEPVLTFQAWLHSELNYDGFNVGVSVDGGQTFETPSAVRPAYGDVTNSGTGWSGNRSAEGWVQHRVDLAAYVGQTIHLRLGFQSDGSVSHAGAFIDDLLVADAAGMPLSIVSSILPVGFVGSNYQWALERSGGNAEVEWEIVSGSNHGWLVIDPATGVLSGVPQTMGATTVDVRVTQVGQPWNQAEKTFSFTVEGPVIYGTGFEDCTGWTFGPATQRAGDWACGVPTTGPGEALDGLQVLATGPNANYASSMRPDTHYALSPPITLGHSDGPILSFNAWSHTENNWDGLVIHITTDGETYELVQPGSPAYRLVAGTTTALPGWSGDRSALGWERYLLDLSPWAGETVQIRFGFYSDGSSEHAGFYIDRMRIERGAEFPIELDAESHLSAFVGVPYAAPTKRFGGSGDVVWSFASAVPGWLSIDPETGVVSGTPPTRGPVEFTVRASDPWETWNVAEQSFTLYAFAPMFLETFDDCEESGWVLTGGWECGVPTTGPEGALTGTNVIATNLAGDYSASISWGSWTATSPALITAPAAGGQLLLEFNAWLRTESCCDGFNLQVSTDGGATFVLVTDTTPAYGSTVGTPAMGAWRADPGVWRRYTADLSAWAGETILLRFDFRSDGGIQREGVYINDLTISY